MKKIIALFVLMFAFTFNANAQDNTMAQELAKKDTYAIAQYLGLKGEALKDLNAVFTEKHKNLLTEGDSEERKIIQSRYVETKFNSILTKDQIAKLKLNQELYKKLTRN